MDFVVVVVATICDSGSDSFQRLFSNAREDRLRWSCQPVAQLWFQAEWNALSNNFASLYTGK